jgi:hypothetical protein
MAGKDNENWGDDEGERDLVPLDDDDVGAELDRLVAGLNDGGTPDRMGTRGGWRGGGWRRKSEHLNQMTTVDVIEG